MRFCTSTWDTKVYSNICHFREKTGDERPAWKVAIEARQKTRGKDIEYRIDLDIITVYLDRVNLGPMRLK